MAEVKLTADGERALQEAQNFCLRTNVAIVAPEHVLAGALKVVGESGTASCPGASELEAAVLASQGSSSEPLDANVMFGSAARAAINFVAAGAQNAGTTEITAALLAAGTIESGEVGPMFFSALGVSRQELLASVRE